MLFILPQILHGNNRFGGVFSVGIVLTSSVKYFSLIHWNLLRKFSCPNISLTNLKAVFLRDCSCLRIYVGVKTTLELTTLGQI